MLPPLCVRLRLIATGQSYPVRSDIVWDTVTPSSSMCEAMNLKGKLCLLLALYLFVHLISLHCVSGSILLKLLFSKITPLPVPLPVSSVIYHVMFSCLTHIHTYSSQCPCERHLSTSNIRFIQPISAYNSYVMFDSLF